MAFSTVGPVRVDFGLSSLVKMAADLQEVLATLNAAIAQRYIHIAKN